MDYAPLYSAYDECLEKQRLARERGADPLLALLEQPGIKSFTKDPREKDGEDSGQRESMDGFKRMERCRIALDALDSQGWKRSFFQKKFHNAFMAACTRFFFLHP